MYVCVCVCVCCTTASGGVSAEGGAIRCVTCVATTLKTPQCP